MPKILKILHICETAMGGVGVYQKYLAEMPASDVEQTFLMPDTDARIMEGDPRVVTFPKRSRGVVTILRQIVQMLRQIRRDRPDVVVFHSTFSLFALLALRVACSFQARPKLIYIAHGWAADQYGSSRKAGLVRAVEGRLCALADLVVNVSRNDFETARRHGYRGHHLVIENAVPECRTDAVADRFTAAPDRLHLLFVGRFDRQKGLDILIESFARVRDQRPDIALHLIGDAVRGGRRPELPGDVDLIGWVPRDEIDHWYRSADALIVPSRWEGLPLVIPEALRNGTPVLVSRRSGMEHLFEEGVEGLGFDLEVAQLAERLRTLDRATLRAIRPACRALYLRRYSMGRLHAEMLNLYRGGVSVASTRDEQRSFR